jgi:alanyl-tRNA synthetase
MTARLYFTDSYLQDFHATVVAQADGGRRLYLDRTAFYPTSGGQPHDTGTIAGAALLDVVDEEDRIAHVLAAPVAAAEVECRLDWVRRFDHMQQHTGQHVLSAVLVELFGAPTVGFHLGTESAAIDIAVDELTEEQSSEAERRANEVVFENRAVSVSFEDAGEASGLRKAAAREGTLRIVSIDGLDRSACGGTHVRATGEIGPILVRKLDRAHGNVRIEFLCGRRAVRRARADYEALARAARSLSAALDEVPALAATQAEALAAAQKARRKLAIELAGIRGRELYSSTSANAAGRRCHLLRIKGALDDEVRALAQGFTAGANACFLALSEQPPAALLAVSGDAGLDAGNVLRQAVSARGGRGGGNAQIAQGSLPAAEALAAVAGELTALFAKNP